MSIIFHHFLNITRNSEHDIDHFQHIKRFVVEFNRLVNFTILDFTFPVNWFIVK
jgi:hypothetical protein